MAVELSSQASQQLRLCASRDGLDDKPFKALVKGVIAIITDQAEEQALQEAPALQNLAGTVYKACYTGLTTFVLEASRIDASNDTISAALEDLGWNEDRITLLVEQLQNAKVDIRARLRLSGFSLPAITDVTWKLDYVPRTSLLDKVNEPVYTVTFKTEEAGKELGEVTMTCNQAQLQDLVDSLKSACASAEALAES
eukprot:TRINITY_DN3329_c0_g2_i1.p1 TRINITY_DN3329_c0_g2~~TRINITY_DN3329_c0_g2_i1.p1  ORF type:complete len:197 (+),score=48.39 TRINITY_DN3329_c0_g2_i1:2-592(+)